MKSKPKKSPNPPGTRIIAHSTNRKIAPKFEAATTYAAQVSCPSSCTFYNAGCYAEKGRTNLVTQKVNQDAIEHELSSLEVAYAEARGISTLSGTLPLRLHTVGDCKGLFEANAVSLAATEYQEKYHAPVWTYTHGWRETPRAAWRKVSVLASVHSLEDCHEAREAGYAPALVAEHRAAVSWREEGLTFVPCPEQTGKASHCTSCRLCFDDRKLYNAKIVIVFAPH